MKSIDTVPAWYWPDGVPRYQSPPRSTLYKTAIERWARRTPGKIALDQNGSEIDFRTLDERVKRASTLIQGAFGDYSNDSRKMRVAVAAIPSTNGAVAILGALHAGADTLLLDPAASDADLRQALATFGCELLLAEKNAGLVGTWKAASLEEVACDVGEEEPHSGSLDRSQAGRLGFRWGDAIVMQPSAALLGWSVAFRDFAMLDKSELFTVSRPFSTWEGMIGLLAPLAVGSTAILQSTSLAEVLDIASNKRLNGIWLDWSQAEALASDLSVAQRGRQLKWIYISVNAPFSVRKRRRLGRRMGSQILTVLGTPATGPVAGSPRTWLIDEAVGTPTTGVDLFPVNSSAGHLADAPWPLLASAGIGVKSTLAAPEMSIEGTAPGRFISNDIFDTGASGVVDANGFLYLV